MRTKLIDFDVHIPNGAGTEVAKTVKVKIPVRYDENTKPGEEILTPKAHEIIDGTKKYHMQRVKEEEARNGTTTATA